MELVIPCLQGFTKKPRGLVLKTAPVALGMSALCPQDRCWSTLALRQLPVGWHWSHPDLQQSILGLLGREFLP